MVRAFVSTYPELKVYQIAFDAAVEVHELASHFPVEEMELAHQLVQLSRGVCLKIAKAWQRRRYAGAFVAGLNQAQADAAGMQCLTELANMADCFEAEQGQELFQRYRQVIVGLERLMQFAEAWTVNP